MKTLKILTSLYTLPTSESIIPLFFKNLLPILKKYTSVEIIWLVYTPEKLNLSLYKNDQNNKILDIHNYDNVMDVLQQEKPDLIFARASWDLIEFALSAAGKSLNIPVASLFMNEFAVIETSTRKITSNMKRFFQSSTPTDTETSKKQFMKRGRFFIYKYLFCLKTQFAINHNIIQTIKSFFIILHAILIDYKQLYNSRFSNSVHWLQSETMIEPLIDSGFEKSSLIVTGNPIYDAAFKKIKNWKLLDSNGDKIRVLFAPSTLYEHGVWTREQRDTAIKETVTKILENKNKMSLVIKIHPSSANLSEYKSIIHKIDPSIQILQDGNFLDLLFDADVVITFGYTTVDVFTILAKKPIVICNYFNTKVDEASQQVPSLECRDPNLLVEIINTSLSQKISYEQKYDDFIKDFFYMSDGLASERICDSIMKIIKNK
jgi:hypothetical protein